MTDASADGPAIRRWYESRRVPWGLRVPLELDLDFGEPLFVKRCVALLQSSSPTAAQVSCSVRRELAASVYVKLEAAAFAYEESAASAWVQPQFGQPGFRHWVATVDEDPAAIGTTIRTDGDAGPAAYLTGLALLPGSPVEALRRLVAVAAADAFAGGACFVHTNPGSAEEDEVLAPHEPIEVPGYLIHAGGG